MTDTVDLSAADLAIARVLLAAWLPEGVRAWVFGSRAVGRARRYSDLDLALEGAERLDPTILSSLAEALSESDLTIKVDVVDLRQVDPAFRRLVEPMMVPLVFRQRE